MIRTSCVLIVCLAGSLPARAAGATPAKPTVAVLYFDYEGQTEGMGQLRKGLAQMLISDLAEVEAAQIVERSRLQDILDELDLNQSKKIDKSTANKIGKLLGARDLVMGGYFDLMGTLRVDARVVEVETGKIVRAVGESCKPEEFMAMEQRLASGLEGILRTALEAPPPPTKAKRTKRPKRPKSLDVKTATRYGKALDAADRGDTATAKKEMKKVVEAQPDFELAALDLSRLAQ